MNFPEKFGVAIAVVAIWVSVVLLYPPGTCGLVTVLFVVLVVGLMVFIFANNGGANE